MKAKDFKEFIKITENIDVDYGRDGDVLTLPDAVDKHEVFKRLLALEKSGIVAKSGKEKEMNTISVPHGRGDDAKEILSIMLPVFESKKYDFDVGYSSISWLDIQDIASNYMDLDDVLDVIKKVQRKARSEEAAKSFVIDYLEDYMEPQSYQNFIEQIDQEIDSILENSIVIRYYEGSYKYDDEIYTILSIKSAQQHALEKLQQQYNNTKTDKKLWATFSPSGKGEEFDARVTLKV